MIITTANEDDLSVLLAFRQEAADWLSERGSEQWSRPYPADRLLATIRAGNVFMVRDGDVTAATISLAGMGEAGLWNDAELAEPSAFVSKLTVARTHSGKNLGGQLLDWAGDRACSAGAKWLRLDAWTTNHALHRYYLRQGFEHVRTVREGAALSGGPRVSGWLAQRLTRRADHGLADEATRVEPSSHL